MYFSQFLQCNGLLMKTKFVQQAVSNHNALKEAKLQ